MASTSISVPAGVSTRSGHLPIYEARSGNRWPRSPVHSTAPRSVRPADPPSGMRHRPAGHVGVRVSQTRKAHILSQAQLPHQRLNVGRSSPRPGSGAGQDALPPA